MFPGFILVYFCVRDQTWIGPSASKSVRGFSERSGWMDNQTSAPLLRASTDTTDLQSKQEEEARADVPTGGGDRLGVCWTRTARGDQCDSSACIQDQVSQSRRDFRPARGEAADLNTHSCRSSSVWILVLLSKPKPKVIVCLSVWSQAGDSVCWHTFTICRNAAIKWFYPVLKEMYPNLT